MDRPARNADGSYDLYFGSSAPAGEQGNWVATVPDKGYFIILRLYSPKKEFFDQTWKPDDVKKISQ